MAQPIIVLPSGQAIGNRPTLGVELNRELSYGPFLTIDSMQNSNVPLVDLFGIQEWYRP